MRLKNVATPNYILQETKKTENNFNKKMHSLIVITASKKTLINFSATTLSYFQYMYSFNHPISGGTQYIFNIKTKPSYSQKQKNQATLFYAISLDVHIKE